MDCTGRQRHHHSSHHRYLRSRNLQTTGCGVLHPCARNAGVFVTPDLRIKQTWVWTMSTPTLARQTEHIRLQQAESPPARILNPPSPLTRGSAVPMGLERHSSPRKHRELPENIDDLRASPADVRPSSRRKSGLCPHLLFVTSKPLRPAGKRTAT